MKERLVRLLWIPVAALGWILTTILRVYARVRYGVRED